MDRSEILKRVQEVTATILNIDESDCTEDKSFTADLGAESIQSVELMAGFNAEFDIEMDEEGALECNDIRGAVDFIANYV
ncbi:acyl carrier protein [Candidatus Latescibacterota bacterium]